MQALRVFWRKPAFAVMAVAVVALSIGANTAVFSFINGVLLRPLPFPGEDRIMQVFPAYRAKPDDLLLLSLEEYEAWSPALDRFFESLALYRPPGNANLTGLGEPKYVSQAEVGAGLFDVFALKAHRGRFFSRDGGAAVISYSFWRGRLGGDESLVGKNVFLDDYPLHIVGIAPPEFDHEGVDLWRELDTAHYAGEAKATLFCLAGRLRSRIDPAAVQNALASLPRSDPSRPLLLRVVPLREFLTGGYRRFLGLLSAAVGLVLLIACANLAGLMLERASARTPEIAIRVALGASPSRIFALVLGEGLVLSLAGGLAGLLLGWWCLDLVKAMAPPDLPRLDQVGLDLRVAGFALALAVLTGFVFAAGPALRAAGLRALHLHGDSRSWRVRRILSAGELALSLCLLSGAAVLAGTMVRLQRVALGFDTFHVVSFKTALPAARYRDLAARRSFIHRALAEVESIPGVQVAGAVNLLPLGAPGAVIAIALPGVPPAAPGPFFHAGYPVSQTRIITRGYFAAMGIPLLRGSSVPPAGASCSVVVNQKLVETFFAGSDPIGRPLNEVDRRSGAIQRSCTITGVCGDVRHWGAAGDQWPEVYFNLDQLPSRAGGWARDMSFVVNVRGESGGVPAALQKAVLRVDPDQPVYSVRTMAELNTRSTSRQRFALRLLAIFAALSVALAAFGTYTVIAHAVSRRTREIGIRMAAGATPRQIASLFMRDGLVTATAGIAAGLPAGVGLTRLLHGLIAGVDPEAGLPLLAAVVFAAGITLAASWIPTRRASRVDPVLALRNE